MTCHLFLVSVNETALRLLVGSVPLLIPGNNESSAQQLFYLLPKVEI